MARIETARPHGKRNQICIYCGLRPSTRIGDHIPPRAFFGGKLPPNVISVPCCRECNGKIGRDDEVVRDLLTSLAGPERHRVVQSMIAPKRYRALLPSPRRVQRLMNTMVVKPVYSPGRIYLGDGIACDLNQPEFIRFMARIARAMLYWDVYVTGHIQFRMQWRPLPTLEALSDGGRNFYLTIPPTAHGTFGEHVFDYLGYYVPGRPQSIWLFEFYGSAAFQLAVMPPTYGEGILVDFQRLMT